MKRKRINLTTKAVENLKIPDAGRYEVWDAAIPNLGLRISERRLKTWMMVYRVNGKQRRQNLGRYPTMGLADARRAAQDILEKSQSGVDVVLEKAAAKHRINTEKFQDVAAEFIERYAKPKNKHWKGTADYFDRVIIPRWKDRPIASIKKAEVHALLDTYMREGKPIAANRCLAAIRKLFNWCVERGILELSPCHGIRSPGKENSRDRVLEPAEIAAIWQAADKVGWPFHNYIKVLMLVGQRRTEVASMEWKHIDFENKLWTLPRENTKAKRQHTVPLTDTVIALIQQQPPLGTFVFTTKGDRPISGFTKMKKRLLEKAGLEDNWCLHDFRRTVASSAAQNGTSVHVISQLLNHSPGSISGVTAIYNRYRYLPEMRIALSKWEDRLQEIFTEHCPAQPLLLTYAGQNDAP
jgi:integrase